MEETVKGIGLLTTVTVAAALLAQTPLRVTPTRPAPNSPSASPTDNTPSKKPGTAEGVVINSVTGQPVKKATVTLRGFRNAVAYAAVTDAAGHFLVENMEPGRYQAMASGDGFIPDRVRGNLFAASIDIAEEQHVKNITVKLMPLGLASGHVVDEDGDPIAGANVAAQRYVYNSGRKQLNFAGNATTNDLGEFQMLDLQPGRYYFQLTYNRYRPPIPGHVIGKLADETYPITYYPSVLDIGQASLLEVTAGGQLSNVDFRLHKTRSYHVRGKVVDANGQAARNAFVQILPAGGGFFPRLSAPLQPDGSFDVGGVMSGSYALLSQRQEGGTPVYARKSINVGDQDVDDVALVLTPGFDISGSVQVEGAPPVAPKPDGSQPAPQPRRLQVTLQSAERIGPIPRALVEDDGTFVLHNVMGSVYQINTFSGPGQYLKTIRFGDRDIPGAEIDLTQQSGGSLKLVFGTDGGQIDGTVQNKTGDNAAGIMVLVAPGEEFEGRGDLFKQAMTDESGHFHVQDVAPGNYKVFAWEEYDYMTSRSPEVRKIFESKAASVSVGANGRESIQLKAISGEDVAAEKSRLP
jgi:protocatechuate 3,4-dioxygenase beta subunit